MVREIGVWRKRSFDWPTFVRTAIGVLIAATIVAVSFFTQ